MGERYRPLFKALSEELQEWFAALAVSLLE